MPNDLDELLLDPDRIEPDERLLLEDLMVPDLEDLVEGRVTLVFDLEVLFVPTLLLVLVDVDLPTRVLLIFLDVAALDKRFVE